MRSFFTLYKFLPLYLHSTDIYIMMLSQEVCKLKRLELTNFVLQDLKKISVTQDTHEVNVTE